MAGNGDEEVTVAAPKFRFEWNLNTVVVVAGFIGGFVTWGYTLADIQSGRRENKDSITSLSARVSANETAIRRLDNHELRITNMEKAATDATASMRSLETTLNGLASDMKVTREILQRIEASQKTRE